MFFIIFFVGAVTFHSFISETKKEEEKKEKDPLERLKFMMKQIEDFKDDLKKSTHNSMKEVIDEIFSIDQMRMETLTEKDFIEISQRLKLLLSQWIIHYEINEKENQILRIKLNSHISTTDPYNHSILSNQYKEIRSNLSSKLFNTIIKREKLNKTTKRNTRTLLINFLNLIFKTLDESVDEYLKLNHPDLLKQFFEVKDEDKNKFQDWVEYGLCEFGKNKTIFIQKIKDQYKEVDGLLEDKLLQKTLNDLFQLSLKMRLATPESRLDFSGEGKEFDEDRNEAFSLSMKTSGPILQVLLPTYIVKDGLSNEDRVFQKSIVITEMKEDE